MLFYRVSRKLELPQPLRRDLAMVGVLFPEADRMGATERGTEKEVLQAVEENGAQKGIDGVVERLKPRVPERDVREAVRTLIEDGSLEVTADWGLRARKKT